MSNLIKYPFVNMAGKEAVVIDNNNKETVKFVPLKNDSQIKMRTISEIEAEKALLHATGIDDSDESGKEEGAGEFKAGLNASNLNDVIIEKKRKAEEDAEKLIEQAEKNAEKIKNEASIAAEAARTHGYEEGKEQGYNEGMAQALQEIQQKEEELAESARMQKEEMAEYMSSIEGKYVEVLIALVKKLTGVVIEGKDDLILYLIQTAARELEPSDNYRIRVSPDDIYFLESHRGDVLDSLGDDIFLEFVEEKGLEKGQCIIETDGQMADCGFQTQLDTLVHDLRMLVH